jgi:acetyl esterase/lipase
MYAGASTAADYHRAVDTPPYLLPFVLATPDAERQRRGNVDLYLPAATEPRPVVVFVHGGPIAVDLTPTPRDWPGYLGYGANVAARGAVAAVIDHRLYGVDAYPTAAQDVADAVQRIRDDPRVDADHVALWFFSGGGLHMAPWLSEVPEWLRCVAASYPVLDVPPEAGVDPTYRPIDAVTGAAGLPIILSRAGLERPALLDGVDAFAAAARSAGVRLTVIDVPHGHHGFDQIDHSDESRAAVGEALDHVLAAITPLP